MAIAFRAVVALAAKREPWLQACLIILLRLRMR